MEQGRDDFFGQNEAKARELFRQQGFAGTDIEPLHRDSERAAESLRHPAGWRHGNRKSIERVNRIAGTMNL